MACMSRWGTRGSEGGVSATAAAVAAAATRDFLYCSRTACGWCWWLVSAEDAGTVSGRASRTGGGMVGSRQKTSRKSSWSSQARHGAVTKEEDVGPGRSPFDRSPWSRQWTAHGSSKVRAPTCPPSFPPPAVSPSQTKVAAFRDPCAFGHVAREWLRRRKKSFRTGL